MTATVRAIGEALGLAPSTTQVTQLEQYLALLQRWGATYNLTAIRDPAEMLVQHVADSLAVIPPLLKVRASGSVLDVGSGAGLPGVPIAVMAPDLQVTCIDAVGKKAAFVRQVAGALGLDNLTAVHGRVEAVRRADRFDIIISRAFASLRDFTTLTGARLASGGVWLAMKGAVPDTEIAAVEQDVDVFHVEQLTVPGLSAQRCLVWMRQRRDASETAIRSSG